MHYTTFFKRKLYSPYIKKWSSPLDEKEKWNWEKIWTRSKSGGTIVALCRRPDRVTPKATIVLAHPLDGSAKGFFFRGDYIESLFQLGLNVVVFDFNGFGQSTWGNFDYVADVIAIGKKVRELVPGKPIGFHGIGFGAYWGAIAISKTYNPYAFTVLEDLPLNEAEFLNLHKLPKGWYNIGKHTGLLQAANYNVPESLRNSININAMLINAAGYSEEMLNSTEYLLNLNIPKMKLSYFNEVINPDKDTGRFSSKFYIDSIVNFFADSIIEIEQKLSE